MASKAKKDIRSHMVFISSNMLRFDLEFVFLLERLYVVFNKWD